jgi:DNA polymerase-1
MIIDGNSIINRAYYGIRPLSTKDGIPTNGIFGFINIMMKNISEENPDYLCVAFDLKALTFRHKEYSLYKAQRKGMPEDLAEQMPHLKELLDAMNIKMLSIEGYEADDIIGTVSSMCEREGVKCDIVTGDKDDLQLASDNTTILLTTTRMGQTTSEKIDRKAFEEKYRITPEEFIDVKALMGDTSDNIPGVPGIGEKTAFALIEEFHSIDGVYENIDSPLIKKGQRQKLEEGRESAYLSRHLATIVRDVPIDFSIEDALIKEYDFARLTEKLERLELKKTAERLGITAQRASEEEKIEKADSSVLENVQKSGEFFFFLKDEINFGFEGKNYVCDFEEAKNILKDANVKKYTFDYKKAKHIFDDCGIELLGEYYDFSLAEYVLNPSLSKYEPENILPMYSLNSYPSQFETLYRLQTERIEQNNQEKLLYDIELPLTSVLFDMEKTGFLVDKNSLADFGKNLGERLAALEETICFTAGKKFNINSTKQLGEVLFEDLKLPVVKKTKRGYSTDSEVLEKLSGKHEIVDLISEFRVLGKLKSTYADGLLDVISPDGRIRSMLNQTVTATGRISSSEPNLQNIPTRTPLGREIRKMFVAKEGYFLVGADYSQIELRVLAHISGDENMTKAFVNDEDIHTLTASQVFNVPEFMVTPEMRSAAKTVNFGIIYGQGDFSLAKELKISVKAAKQYIESYFEKYEGVKKYMEETIAKAKEDGFVTTLFGRRRYVEELKAKNRNLVAFGERVAMNTPIQGSAADIIKIAMIKVQKALNEKCPSSHLVMQVHDELIVEAHPDELNTVAEILKTEMENAVKLSVPLVADVKTGKSWYDTK